MARPVIVYLGGKYRIAEWVVSHFPPHTVYAELFGGAASILMTKERAATEIYNDLDEGIVNLFRVMQDREKARELEYRLRYTPYSRYELFKAYEEPKDDIDAARGTIVKSFMGMATGGAYRKGRVGFGLRLKGGICAAPAAWRNYADCIKDFCERMQGVIIENKDARILIPQLDTPDTLFYLDPPYVSDKWYSKSGYTNNGDENLQAEILELIKSIKGMAILSGYDNELYNAELKDWKKVSKETINVNNDPRIECLWISPNAQRKTRKECYTLWD